MRAVAPRNQPYLTPTTQQYARATELLWDTEDQRSSGMVRGRATQGGVPMAPFEVDVVGKTGTEVADELWAIIAA